VGPSCVVLASFRYLWALFSDCLFVLGFFKSRDLFSPFLCFLINQTKHENKLDLRIEYEIEK
jgi:hypothetical protein